MQIGHFGKTLAVCGYYFTLFICITGFSRLILLYLKFCYVVFYLFIYLFLSSFFFYYNCFYLLSLLYLRLYFYQLPIGKIRIFLWKFEIFIGWLKTWILKIIEPNRDKRKKIQCIFASNLFNCAPIFVKELHKKEINQNFYEHIF